jgi:excisionase family DNA binding protein|tara:strand:+ start:465 stop:665 length:201 start_codon:yes stop_codon:yes gene_type:complete
MSRSEREYVKNIIEEVLFYNKQLSVNECCEYLNKNRKTILSAIDRNEIDAKRVGKQYIIPMLQFLK